MTGADQNHPWLGAEVTSPEVRGRVPERCNQRVEASISEVAGQRAPIGLEDGELDSGPLAAESLQEMGSRAPAGSGGDSQPQAPDHARLEIGSRCTRRFLGSHGDPRTNEEKLSHL